MEQIYANMFNSIGNHLHAVGTVMLKQVTKSVDQYMIDPLFITFQFISEAMSVYYIKYCSEIGLTQKNVYISINNRYTTIKYLLILKFNEYRSQHLKLILRLNKMHLFQILLHKLITKY